MNTLLDTPYADDPRHAGQGGLPTDARPEGVLLQLGELGPGRQFNQLFGLGFSLVGPLLRRCYKLTECTFRQYSDSLKGGP